MINFKSNKGSVTLYVLTGMSLVTISLLAIYMFIANKQVTQLEVSEQIKSVYEKDFENIELIYDSLISGK